MIVPCVYCWATENGTLKSSLRLQPSAIRGEFAFRVGYEEPLAHRLVAGGDILLHPARYEPCGLTQLYAMRYGTLPVVRNTGGLRDTVVDTTDDTLKKGTATGFIFNGTTSDDMVRCIERALALYRQPVAWRKVQLQVMAQDFGWEKPAHCYLSLYRSLLPHAAARRSIPTLSHRGRARARASPNFLLAKTVRR